ncbi:PAS domain-containing protein [Dongia sp.]|uniref:PAS domain-containing protein n=1 Tax=Dongia sp. TaxID=1977262 RepID=UPI0035B3DB9F
MKRAAQISELDSAPLLRLETYWREKRADRAMPSRNDIDPAEIKELLPQIIMARIEYDPLRVKYSIVGTACARHAGFDYTGRYLDELDFASETDTDWMAIYAEIVARKQPVAGTCLFRTADLEVPYRVAVFPLSSDGVRVDHTIAYEHLTLSLTEMDHVLPVKPTR